MTTLLLAALLTQTKGAEETTLIAPGSPRVGFLPGQSGMITAETHSVTLTLRKTRVFVESITTYRCAGPNLGSPIKPQVAKAMLEFPIWVEGWASQFGSQWMATWSNAPVQFRPAVSDPSTGGVPRYLRWQRADVEVPPSGTKTLRATASFPLQVVGLDGKQRRIAYRLDQMRGVRQVNITIKQDPGVVFQTVRLAPSNLNWKSDSKGSFAQLNNPNLDQPILAEFVFYPDGF